MRVLVVSALGAALVSCSPDVPVPRRDPALDQAPPSLGPVNVLMTGGGCARIQAAVNEPVRVTMILWPEGQEAVELAGGDAQPQVDEPLSFRGLAVGLAALVVRVTDSAGNAAESDAVGVDITAAPPPLVISEVLSNPSGAEGSQEWLELTNAGEVPFDLSGYSFHDSTGADALPQAVLPPGARALLVPSGFSPGSSSDVPPAADAQLLRVDSRLGANGLSNSGEAIRLEDASGRVVSSYGGWVDNSGASWAGKSVQRSSLEACDHPSSWTQTAQEPTPGW